MAKKALETDDEVRREVDALLGAFGVRDEVGDAFVETDVTSPAVEVQRAAPVSARGAEALWSAGPKKK